MKFFKIKWLGLPILSFIMALCFAGIASAAIVVTHTSTGTVHVVTYDFTVPATIDLGNVVAGSSGTKVVTITNSGTGNLSSISATGSNGGVTVSGTGGALSAGASEDITLTITVGASVTEGDHTVTITFSGSN